MDNALNLFSFHLDNELPANREVHTLLPAMVLSKAPLSYHSTLAAEANFVLSDILETHLTMLADFAYTIVNIYHGEEIATQHYDQLIKIHKLRQKKFKTRNDMNALLIGRKIVKEELKFVKSWMQWKQVTTGLYRAIPFYAKQYYEIISHIDDNKGRQKDAQEDEKTIKAFIGIVGHESTEDLNLCMENTMRMMEAMDVTEAKRRWNGQGFLKLPLFEMPGFLSFKASKFTLLRDELQPQLGNWWKALTETLKSMQGIDFTEENAELLKQNLSSLMKPAADGLKEKMEHSIYLQQLANDEFGEYKGKVSLCLTGVRNLLHAYNDTNQVSDAVMNKVEDYYKNRGETDRVICFLLHEVAEYPPLVRYTESDHEYLNNTWKEMMDEIETARK